MIVGTSTMKSTRCSVINRRNSAASNPASAPCAVASALRLSLSSCRCCGLGSGTRSLGVTLLAPSRPDRGAPPETTVAAGLEAWTALCLPPDAERLPRGEPLRVSGLHRLASV